jgi:hypothetical protein
MMTNGQLFFFTHLNYEKGRGKSIFGFFGIFNFLQFAVDGKKNSKTKVQKVFFFIFMSSYAKMSFLK